MIKPGASLLPSVLLLFTVTSELMHIPLLARDKTDVVILKNGDHVTGEIKSLDRGKMTLSTDSMGTVQIEWEDVARVTSLCVFGSYRSLFARPPPGDPEKGGIHQRSRKPKPVA